MKPVRGLPGEARLARLLWRWLIRRGWPVQLNHPSAAAVDEHGAWRPLWSVRYGRTPVYRAPGDVRWVEQSAEQVASSIIRELRTR